MKRFDPTGLRFPTCGCLAACLSVIALLPGCNQRTEIDYGRRKAIQTVATNQKKPPDVIRVAVASILSAERSFARYQELLTYVCSRCSLTVQTTYSKEYSGIYRQFESNEVDIGMVCTALYVIGKRKGVINMLAVPVVNGQSIYWASVIVPQSLTVDVFKQLRGKRFAFTDRLSLTGYFYPLFRSGAEPSFFSETIFTGSHDKAVQLVSSGLVDGASVDGLVLDDLLRRTPRLAGSIRIIEKSTKFGIPPVVVSRQLDRQTADKLRTSFLTLHRDSVGRELLEQTGIERFEAGHDTLYAGAFRLVSQSVSP